MAQWLKLSEIEKFIYDKMKEVSDNVFINAAPKSVSTPMKDYIVMSMGNAVYDRNAYKESYLLIYLYVRTKKTNIEDTLRLEELSNKILSFIPMATKNFSLTSPNVSYGAKLDEFSKVTIKCDLLIKNVI